MFTTLASKGMIGAYSDFITCAHSLEVNPASIQWYESTAGDFCKWCSDNGIDRPESIETEHVERRFAELRETVEQEELATYMRAVQSLLHFFYVMGYINRLFAIYPESVKVTCFGGYTKRDVLDDRPI